MCFTCSMLEETVQTEEGREKMKIAKGRHSLPREIGVADVFDVGGRRPEGVDKVRQLVLHDEENVDVGC